MEIKNTKHLAKAKVNVMTHVLKALDNNKCDERTRVDVLQQADNIALRLELELTTLLDEAAGSSD